MGEVFNIYCDESGHLERDRQPVMVMGALWCRADACRAAAVRIREIKERHSLSSKLEVKWTKVSPAKAPFFVGLVVLGGLLLR
jgi:hypothetical protein